MIGEFSDEVSSRVELSCLFTPRWWDGVGSGHFLMKVTLLPTSVKETLWDPGKEHQWCSQGLCYCFFALLLKCCFVLSSLFWINKKMR